MPLTSRPRLWPAGQIACPAGQVFVGLDHDFVDTCLHEKGKAKELFRACGLHGTRNGCLSSDTAHS
jgi:hypothetical protein